MSDKQRHIYRALQAFADEAKQPQNARRVVQASYRRIQRYCSNISVRIHISTIRRNISLMVEKELIAPWNESRTREYEPAKGESVIGRRIGEGNRESTWYVIRPYAEVLERLKQKKGVGHVQNPDNPEAFHFAVYGRARRLMTQEEIDRWGVQKYAAWKADRGEQKTSSGPELVSRPAKRPAPEQKPNPPPEGEVDLEPLREAIALNTQDKLIDDAMVLTVWRIAEKEALGKGASIDVSDVCMILRHMRDVQGKGWSRNAAGVAIALGPKVRRYLNHKRETDAANARDAKGRHDRDVREVCRLILAAESGDEISREMLPSVGPELVAEAKAMLRAGLEQE